MKYGFIKTAAASPVIRVADAEYNAQRVIECIADAKAKGVKILVFPELTLTGCSCFDLIAHRVILDGAKAALAKVIAATAGTDMLVFVGLPYAAGSRIYSCAAAICDGELLFPERTSMAPTSRAMTTMKRSTLPSASMTASSPPMCCLSMPPCPT